MIGNNVVAMCYHEGEQFSCLKTRNCLPERAGGDWCCFFLSLGMLGVHKRAQGFVGSSFKASNVR